MNNQSIEKFHMKEALPKLETINGESNSDDVLSGELKHEILTNWVGTLPAFSSYCRMDEAFTERAILFEDNIAIEIGNNQYTYAQINEWSDHLAAQFSKIKGHSVIGLCLDKSIELIVSIIAALKADLTYLPIDPHYPESRISYMLQDSQCQTVVIKSKNSLIKFPQTVNLMVFDEIDLKPTHSTPKVKNTNSNPLACIIYTSGSTGKPKPVMVAHRSIVNLIMNQHKYFVITDNIRMMQFSSISFDASISETWIPLLGGGTLVIPEERYLSGEMLSKSIIDSQINMLIIPPSILDTIPNPKEVSRYLKTIVCAGESLTQSVVNRWAKYVDRFINAYGPSEATVLASFCAYKGEAEFENIIGKPIDGVQVYILNEDLSLAAPNSTGEIYIGGAGVSPGYLHHSELDSSRFIENPFKVNDRLYKTGDLARWLNNGIIQYIGRVDRQIKLNGIRIELEEIENQLANHPDIDLCAVNLEINANSNEKQLVAYFKQRESNKTQDQVNFKQLIREYLRSKLPMSMIPHKYIQLNDLPRSPNGKIDRDKLNSLIENTPHIEKCEESLSDTEEALRTIYADILQLQAQTISIDLNFFDLGASSLQAINALSKINKQFNSNISIENFFEHSDIKYLSSQVTIDSNVDKTSDEKIAQLKSIYLTCLNRKLDERLEDSEDFFDLGGTSLSAIKLLSQIKQSFGIDIAIADFFDKPTLNAIMEKIDLSNDIYTIAVDKPHENTLEDDLFFNMESLKTDAYDAVAINDVKNILLTGANGFLGAYLLSGLLKMKSDTIVHCLVRSTDNENPSERLKSSLQDYGFTAIDFNRIKIYEADLSKEKFGLQKNIYDSLSQTVDSIYHCGAFVNHIYTYDMLRKANVLGTIEVIKLANSVKQKYIQYVSALDIALLKNQCNRFEQEKDKAMGEIGYIQTKWVSEYLLEKASMVLKLPINIFRPGNIIGDLKRGIMDPNKNHFLMLTKSCIQLAHGPNSEFLVEMTPVDIVSDSIVALSKIKPKNNFNIYNVHNPNYLSWQHYVKLLKTCGFEFELVDPKVWSKSYMSTIDDSNVLFPFKDHYAKNDLRLNSGLAELVHMHVPKLLKPFGITFPNDYQVLVAAYMKQLQDIAFL